MGPPFVFGVSLCFWGQSCAPDLSDAALLRFEPDIFRGHELPAADFLDFALPEQLPERPQTILAVE